MYMTVHFSNEYAPHLFPFGGGQITELRTLKNIRKAAGPAFCTC